MPRGDRTGPSGMGPMTGRGMGSCASYPISDYADSSLEQRNGEWRGFGLGRKRGRGLGLGRGFGFGFGRGFRWR